MGVSGYVSISLWHEWVSVGQLFGLVQWTLGLRMYIAYKLLKSVQSEPYYHMVY